MRAIILAAIVAAGIGFIGTQTASAAPANGVTIGDTANTNQPIVKVQHWRWGSHGYRHYHRCHYRYRSWGRCW
ncbi:MAG TPA: hypothetical protein VIE87_00565 [Pseudolabrys sp.]|jgi:hypothetical protein